MNRRNNMVIGGIFVLLGCLFLLKNLNIFDINFDIFDIFSLVSTFWPALFLILPGALMHLKFFSGSNNDAGVLVPGGILVTTGAVCQIGMLFGNWTAMWPGFIAAVAVGLFELYLFGTRDKGLLVPVFILGTVSVISFWFSIQGLWWMNMRRALVPIILILFGVMIIFNNRPKRKDL